MLASDCNSGLFNITTQNVPCNSFSDVSCARSTTINLFNKTIVFGQGGRVTVDSTVVMLPYTRQGILIRQVFIIRRRILKMKFIGYVAC